VGVCVGRMEGAHSTREKLTIISRRRFGERELL
jgi:hypothetical protein